MLIYSLTGWIHLSLGKADRWFRWGVIQVCAMTLMFLLALPWGAAGIAVAWTTSFWILTLPGLRYAGEPVGLRVTSIFLAVWKYIGSGLLAGYTSILIIRKFPVFAAGSGAAGALTRVVVTSVLFGSLYLLAVILTHRGVRPIREVAAILKDAASRRKARGALPDMAAMAGFRLGSSLTVSTDRL
jgi:PST family polysaccharide transporter